jgi:hypothetical protein
LPNGALSEQHHRAGPSVHQEADYGWVAKGDAVAQREFIHGIFGVAA